ncbi:hypothetical protein ACIRL0_18940 [Streptomyces sp. NPDC102365]|uniref:hypothetical protein n=1 Tax=Streptomyces sp. NPDC102365 TaxID=3366162 RepID=UPI00382E7079
MCGAALTASLLLAPTPALAATATATATATASVSASDGGRATVGVVSPVEDGEGNGEESSEENARPRGGRSAAMGDDGRVELVDGRDVRVTGGVGGVGGRQEPRRRTRGQDGPRPA